MTEKEDYEGSLIPNIPAYADTPLPDSVQILILILCSIISMVAWALMQ